MNEAQRTKWMAGSWAWVWVLGSGPQDYGTSGRQDVRTTGRHASLDSVEMACCGLAALIKRPSQLIHKWIFVFWQRHQQRVEDNGNFRLSHWANYTAKKTYCWFSMHFIDVAQHNSNIQLRDHFFSRCNGEGGYGFEMLGQHTIATFSGFVRVCFRLDPSSTIDHWESTIEHCRLPTSHFR